MKITIASTVSAFAVALALAGCGGGDSTGSSTAVTPSAAPPPAAPTPPPAVTGVTASSVATFASPWAMVFLPDGRMLVTERNFRTNEAGRLSLVTQAGAVTNVTGLPANIGLLDVTLHPNYASGRQVYYTFIESGGAGTPRVGAGAGDPALSPAGLALGAATLVLDASGGARLEDARVLWRQVPKVVSLPGSGEPGGRVAFSPDARYLFVTAGDRQEFAPVQDLSTTLGKIIRLNADGSIPGDNPFAGRAGALPEIWTLGHRSQYGLAFDASGQLWSHEQGPKGGDEFNLITAGANYGWPNVSNGDHYDGGIIPDHAPGDGYFAPAVSWTPVIAPAGMLFYSSNLFGAWRGDAILTGLQSNGLVRVRVNGTSATEVQRIALSARIREVEQGPDGALWVLEDGPNGGRLLKLTPVF